MDGVQGGRGEPIKGLRGSWGGVSRGRPASNSAGIAACSCERREKALMRGPTRLRGQRGAGLLGSWCGASAGFAGPLERVLGRHRERERGEGAGPDWAWVCLLGFGFCFYFYSLSLFYF